MEEMSDTRFMKADEKRRVLRMVGTEILRLGRLSLEHQLVIQGHEIGSHTHSHFWLPSCSSSELQTEIEGSYQILRDRLGKAPVSLSLPGGGCTRPLLSTIRRAGYRYIATSSHRLNPAQPRASSLVHRFSVDRHHNIDTFKKMISGSRRYRLPKRLRELTLYILKMQLLEKDDLNQ